jgi:hypothetical protein
MTASDQPVIATLARAHDDGLKQPPFSFHRLGELLYDLRPKRPQAARGHRDAAG